MQRKGFFARLADLWRGIWGTKLDDAEARNAEAVYHTAIIRRQQQYDGLKDAVSRVVYLRNRIEADLKRREEDLALVDDGLLRAARSDDDERALSLIRKKRSLETEIERLRGEHVRLTAQSGTAKEGLGEVVKAIKQLKHERGEMLARKAHAMARLEVAAALEQSNANFTGTDQALENVRESIMRLEHKADLGLEADGLAAEPGDVSMMELRHEAEDREDLMALTELKRKLGKRLLPDGIEAEPGPVLATATASTAS